MKWISVKDRLPDDGQRIIFYVDVDSCEIPQLVLPAKLYDSTNTIQFVGSGTAILDEDENGKFLSHVTWDCSGRFMILHAYGYFITHWMELPAPPTESEDK